MRERSRQVRDRVVHALARLSLVAVLALMGALFVGSAAESQARPASGDQTSITDGQQSEPAREGMLEQANPKGLVLAALVIGGGLVVLMVGAFKPERREHERELADILRD